MEDIPQVATLLSDRMTAKALEQFETIAKKCSPSRLRELVETLFKVHERLDGALDADDMLMAEKQLGELDDVDEAVKAVVKAAEGRTAVTNLLNQIREMVDADAFTCLAQDAGLLGDEQAAGSVISVIRKAFDKIDGTLDLDDVKYIARQAKKYGDEEDILNYVLNKHGVKVGVLTSERIEYYLSQSRNNIDSDTVILGLTGKYDVIGKNNGYTYFKMSDDIWNLLVEETASNYDEIWKVNKQFIDEQIALNKNILLSNDPYKGYYFGNGAKRFYQREIDYLTDQGYIFNKISGDLWKVKRK